MTGPRRLAARLSVDRLKPSSSDMMDAMKLTQSPSAITLTEDPAQDEPGRIKSNDSQYAQFLKGVAAWLREEQDKLAKRSGHHVHGFEVPLDSVHVEKEPHSSDNEFERTTKFRNDPKFDSQRAVEKLEKIIKDHMPRHRRGSSRDRSYFHRRKSSSRFHKLGSMAAASDTEYQPDGDPVVPSTDAVLDNSKTLSYTGGAAGAEAETLNYLRNPSDKDGWFTFKTEILRLTHTLRLKGWRRVSLEQGAEIDVQRLSGALTNAVYVVAPPEKLRAPMPSSTDPEPGARLRRKVPSKLLLRIYGPQVDHLIDRQQELSILCRLARQNIGPRMLGTFANGRFEQYFEAKTLKPEDLRAAATSVQIAKRMRELHDGIEVLPEEKLAGPFVWCNWNKWVPRCEKVVSFLDMPVLRRNGKAGFVCGVPWTQFRKAIEKYYSWLAKQYGGERQVNRQLVFAHNDTQYGNLLRLQPPGASPLLHPANEHKQLVVIDFEYAGANLRGFEFANHFSEWCYNYHSAHYAHVCNTAAYPSLEEQRRFITAYVQHHPLVSSSTAASSEGAAVLAEQSMTSSVSTFALDARSPPCGGTVADCDAEERKRDEAASREVERLLRETRRWRIACSAQWVAWGIVQAKVEGLDGPAQGAAADADSDGKHEMSDSKNGQSGGSESKMAEDLPHDHETADDEEFDYLAYARERALFFWGDMLELGLVKEDELPADVVEAAKRVPY